MHVCFFYKYTRSLQFDMQKEMTKTHADFVNMKPGIYRGNCRVYWAARGHWTMRCLLLVDDFIRDHSTQSHGIHGAGIYVNIKGVYSWDPWHTILLEAPWIRHGNMFLGIMS